MFLFALLFSFIGISYLAYSNPPEIPFQQLLDNCTIPEYSHSIECQDFFLNYPWRNEDIPLVFGKLMSRTNAYKPTGWNTLEERLIRLIGNPNFDLASLGQLSFYQAVSHERESLAIAIWPHLGKYKNDSLEFYYHPYSWMNYDFQLFECSTSMFSITSRKMLQLLKKMVSDRPDCLPEQEIIIPQFIGDIAVREFLVDHGVEVTPRQLHYQDIPHEGFEWALLNYRHSNVLINNSIKNGSEIVAVAIWQFLAQKNYNELLLQICSNTVFDVVKTKKVELLKTMLRYFSDCIHSKGNALMDIAIKGDKGSWATIQVLNLYGVEIPPDHIHKSPFFNFPANIDPAIFNCRQQFPHRGAAYDYFMKARKENKNEICNKISAQRNISGIADVLPDCRD